MRCETNWSDEEQEENGKGLSGLYCQIRENSSNNQGLLELSILSLYSYDPNQY